MSTAGLPPVTLIAPAYNEEPTCVESTRSLLTLRYPSYDVSNDGQRFLLVEPTADTARPEIRIVQNWQKAFGLDAEN